MTPSPSAARFVSPPYMQAYLAIRTAKTACQDHKLAGLLDAVLPEIPYFHLFRLDFWPVLTSTVAALQLYFVAEQLTLIILVTPQSLMKYQCRQSKSHSNSSRSINRQSGPRLFAPCLSAGRRAVRLRLISNESRAAKDGDMIVVDYRLFLYVCRKNVLALLLRAPCYVYRSKTMYRC